MKKHIGSTIAIIIGILGVLAGIAEPGDILIAGLVIILGALAYRSAKKRKLGEAKSFLGRKAAEFLAVIIAMALVLLQNNLIKAIESDPVLNLIVPIWVLVAYIIISVRKPIESGGTVANIPTGKSTSILGNILAVLAFIAAFVLVKEFKSEWYNSNSMKDASVTATNKMEKEIQSAKSQSTAKKSATEILAEESHKEIKTTLNNSATNKEKLVAASNMFFGGYFLNTRTRPEFCSKLGVDISLFVNEYKNVHRDLFIAAEKVQIMDFKDNGRTYDMDDLYNLMAPANEKFIAQEMKDTAAYLKTTETGACQSFAQYSTKWAIEADIRKRAPELSQLLLNN